MNTPRSPLVEAITQNRLQELLDYDAESGLFRWRESHKGRSKGRIAGCMSGRGYRRIRVDGRAYPAAQLAWLYVYGEFASPTIDHINRVRSDDRVANLRPATFAQQQANAVMKTRRLRNLPRGVTRNKGNGPYRARIEINGKERDIGYFPTVDEAYAAYCKAARDAFGADYFCGD